MKGINCKVWPLYRMPKDAEGNFTDIIIAPGSVFNRMNPSQFYEQFYNKGSWLMQQRLINGELGEGRDAYNKILEYINDIRPIWAKHIDANIKNESDVEDFLYGVKTDGIYLMFSSFCEHVSSEKCLFLSEKYGIKESRTSYIKYNEETGEEKEIVFKQPVMIGSKYIYLLGKIPLAQLTAIQIGYINQFGTPTKPESKTIKAQSLQGNTPIRYGEAEICMLTMSLGPETVTRFTGITANSPDAIEKIANELLTNPNPSQIDHIDMSTEEINNNNIAANIFSHMMTAIGYDATKETI